ncbi:MAG: hypothetical protein ACW99G_11620 [Candidatus Thorarchaeota archaeon]|jgi:hypothetical protein
MAKLPVLDKQTRAKYLNKYFVDAFTWQVFKVEGIGESKARVRNIISGKGEYIDTDWFLKKYGGCDFFPIAWKPELYSKYMRIDREKGSKHKFQVYVYQPGAHATSSPVIDVKNTYHSLSVAWEAVEVYSKQFPAAEIWFSHVSDTTMKVRGRWRQES